MKKAKLRVLDWALEQCDEELEQAQEHGTSVDRPVWKFYRRVRLIHAAQTGSDLLNVVFQEDFVRDDHWSVLWAVNRVLGTKLSL